MVIQAGAEWATGQAVSALKLYSLIAFVVATILVGVFNACWRVLWRRFPALAKLTFPDLNGTWTGTLHSNWKDPATGKGPGPIETTVWIKQSLLSTSVKQQTLESKSWSTRTFLEKDAGADRYLLWYSYSNRPHANVSAFSPDHDGVCNFEMNIEQSDKSLTGQYYTSRSTAGNIRIERVSRDLKDLRDRAHWASGSTTHPFRWEE